ncbi:MAG: putative molybdenum carrier protein [Deltaproteobacteria bacterium]|nr:putative molybdenum carrier protein [Deltaproteobacteria bacterium]
MALITKIVSGGQTGADRGGLDAAIALGVPHGGWCPKERRAEDGKVPKRYRLRETSAANYQSRTRRNVLAADGTVVFTKGPVTPGSALTVRIARSAGKPCLHLDMNRLGAAAEDRLREWITHHQIRTLNVAGSRESLVPGIRKAVTKFLTASLRSPRTAYVLEEEFVGLDAPQEQAVAEAPYRARGGSRHVRRRLR